MTNNRRAAGPRRLILASLLPAAMAATPVSAAPLKFTFSGGVVGSFILDTTPAPSSTVSVFRGAYGGGTGDFSTNPVGPTGTNVGLVASGAPGFGTLVGQLRMNGGLLGMYGSTRLFTGTGTAPVFTLGSFALADIPFGGTPFTLTIAPGAPAPEVGANWAAAAAAGLALALTRLRRRREPIATPAHAARLAISA